MNNTQRAIKRKVNQGWAALGGGALLLVTGLTLRALFPASVMNFRAVEGFGIMLIGWAGIYLARYLLAAKNPDAARRTIIEDQDERNQLLRNRAGNAAFVFNVLVSSLALIVYSAMTRGQDVDALWLYMAFVVIAPSLFYIGYLVWLRRE